MDSSSLAAEVDCPLNWMTLNDETQRKAPFEIGVYSFRLEGGRKFGRLRGESDIVYIGSASGRGGIRQRLYFHLHPGPSQLTNLRSKQLQGRVHLQVACVPEPNPVKFETKILDQYLEDHWELPPLNRSASKI